MDKPELTPPNSSQAGENHPATLPAMAEATPDGLRRIVANPALSEDLALSLLKRGDLPTGVLEELARNSAAMQSHRVRTRVACHAKTPRHIAIALVRQLYTFELMEVALAPAVLPEIAMAAEQAILMRLEKIACGERVTLARRSSGRLAASLLLDADPRVVEATLDNPRVTEEVVTKAVLSPKSSTSLLELVCHHSKWALRPEIREALLRSGRLPLPQVLEIAKLLPVHTLRALVHDSHLKENIRGALQKELQQRAESLGVRDQ
jgi:hypothetical protein